MSPSDEGSIVVTILIGGIIVLLLWFELIEKPKENKEKNKWIEENQELLKTQNWLSQTLQGLGKRLPACKKCNSTDFQLWEIINDELTIRCTNCKRKEKINLDIKIKAGEGEISFNQLLSAYITLVQFVQIQGETELGKYLRNYLKWDFVSLRKGTPLIRGISFYTNPDYETPINEYDNVQSDEPSRRITDRVKNLVWNRDGGKCVECGSREKLEFDHIIPFSKGGSNGYRNIQLLCEECNRRKSNNIG